MTHPLEHVMRSADGFLLIGESSQGRFPAFSSHAYTSVRKRFYCLDLDGLSESRGPTKGGNVYASVDELPADRDDLAAIWVHPHTIACVVELAHRPSASASDSASSLVTATQWPGCASSAWRRSRSVAAPSTNSTTAGRVQGPDADGQGVRRLRQAAADRSGRQAARATDDGEVSSGHR
jgi:hypothetical protein